MFFEKTEDYMEILFNPNIGENSVINKLITTIPEEDFKNQVEIIGWLYQYYNTEKKDEIINISKGKISKKDIPAATQLFTTDWVVRYMVDNSLGRYWIERNPNSKLKDYLKFYIEESQQDENVKLTLDDIRKENIDVKELKISVCF